MGEKMAQIVCGRMIAARIPVSDIERSYDFYITIFGFSLAVKLHFTNPDIIQYILKDAYGNIALAIYEGKTVSVPATADRIPMIIEIDDEQVVLDKAQEQGYRIAIAPKPFNGLSVFFLTDPDGYLIEVISGTPFEKILPENPDIPLITQAMG